LWIDEEKTVWVLTHEMRPCNYILGEEIGELIEGEDGEQYPILQNCDRSSMYVGDHKDGRRICLCDAHFRRAKEERREIRIDFLEWACMIKTDNSGENAQDGDGNR
jgi:hypothetical protein